MTPTEVGPHVALLQGTLLAPEGALHQLGGLRRCHLRRTTGEDTRLPNTGPEDPLPRTIQKAMWIIPIDNGNENADLHVRPLLFLPDTKLIPENTEEKLDDPVHLGINPQPDIIPHMRPTGLLQDPVPSHHLVQWNVSTVRKGAIIRGIAGS